MSIKFYFQDEGGGQIQLVERFKTSQLSLLQYYYGIFLKAEMENNINTVTTANYSACSGEQPQPDGTITSTQVYSSHALNGTIELNILPTENMEVLCWVF